MATSPGPARLRQVPIAATLARRDDVAATSADVATSSASSTRLVWQDWPERRAGQPQRLVRAAHLQVQQGPRPDEHRQDQEQLAEAAAAVQEDGKQQWRDGAGQALDQLAGADDGP